MNSQKNTVELSRNDAYPPASADEALLKSLGYKQELRRTFTPLELFGVGFSIIGLFPSIAYVYFAPLDLPPGFVHHLRSAVLFSSTRFPMAVLLQ